MAPWREWSGQDHPAENALRRVYAGRRRAAVHTGREPGYLEQNSELDPKQDVYGEMRRAFSPVLDAMARMQVLENKLSMPPADEALLEEHARLSAVVDAADGYNMDVQIKKVLQRHGLWPRNLRQERVAVPRAASTPCLRLAKLLLQRPDLLILDEPTNHLTLPQWSGWKKPFEGVSRGGAGGKP